MAIIEMKASISNSEMRSQRRNEAENQSIALLHSSSPHYFSLIPENLRSSPIMKSAKKIHCCWLM
jgi:hypothetical protein